MFVPGLLSHTALRDKLYIPGWSVEDDDLHVWMVPATGTPKLVKHQRKLLGGAEIFTANAGSRVLIRVARAEDGEPENYLASDDVALPIRLNESILTGLAFAHESGNQLFLQREYEKDKFELLLVDSGNSARPVPGPDGKPLRAARPIFSKAFHLHSVGDDLYCEYSLDENKKALLYLPAKP
jgi:hypothetical protein